MLLTYLILIFLSPLQEKTMPSQESNPSPIQEEFKDLDNWQPFSFSGNKKPTEYRIEADSGLSYLKIISQSSASGIIHNHQYDPNLYPILTWRWQVKNVIPETDGKSKSGDDYAIRIFVMFDDDSAETSFWTSIRNSTINLLYGIEPPESSLCFVWSNRLYSEDYFDNPYSETVKMIPIEMGDEQINSWRSHEVNIVDIFKKIYGRACPKLAKIAVMGDTDNSESQTIAWLDYIRIRSN